MSDLYQAWRSGKVNRMHTMPQLHRENIAEHTWGVMYLLLRYFPECSRDLLIATHAHDAGEIATGDMPGHVKWADPVFGARLEAMEEKHVIMEMMYPYHDINSAEKALLEILDRVEFCVSCLHEMRLGNRNSHSYFNRSANRVNELFAAFRKLENYDGSFNDGINLLIGDLNLCTVRAGFRDRTFLATDIILNVEEYP